MPAFVASRIAARPVAKRIFAQMESESLAPSELLLTSYDQRTDAAVDKMLQALSAVPTSRDAVRQDLVRAVQSAEDWWSLQVMKQHHACCRADADNAQVLSALHSSFTI